jgi:hypothetical protein
MKRSRWKLRVSGLVCIMLILMICWFYQTRQHHAEPSSPTTLLLNQASKNPNQKSPIASHTQTLTPNGGNGGSTANSNSDPNRVDERTMLASLVRWIKRRENKDVRIVDTRKILDIDGKLTSLNVLVTAQLGDGLTAEKLREQLAANTSRERSLQERTKLAFQQADIAAVDRLVAELTEARTAFVTDKQISTYKVSLSTERPPVLAFWPGLPFETVREEAARSLAASRLGNDIDLQGLIYYTSATALLVFADKSGTKSYIDPFQLVEIPIKNLQQPRTKRAARADDQDRNERIASQWADFLQP